MLRGIKGLLAACCTATLVACGGGDGGGSAGPATSTDTFQTRTAYVNYLTNAATYGGSVSGTVSGYPVSGSVTVTQGSLAATVFENQPAQGKTTTLTGSINVNGTSVPFTTTLTMYVDSNYVPLGSNGAEYILVTSSAPIPAVAKVGEKGNWYTANRYSSSSKTTLLGTLSTSFVLEPDTAATAMLKLIQVERDQSNAVTSTSTMSFQITPAGAITSRQETEIEAGGSLTITY